MIPYGRAKRRMVVGHEEELHEICCYHVNEIQFLADKLVEWAKQHQDKAAN